MMLKGTAAPFLKIKLKPCWLVLCFRFISHRWSHMLVTRSVCDQLMPSSFSRSLLRKASFLGIMMFRNKHASRCVVSVACTELWSLYSAGA